MKRRDLVQVVAGTAIAHSVVTVLGCQAQQKAASPEGGKGGHDHHDKKPAPESPVSGPLTAVALATAQCVVAGETCLEHCIRLLSSGDTMMSGCARQVQQMLAICRSMSSLASMGSTYTTEMAALCKKACGACALECEKHAAHHAECKACFESCQGALQALGALV